MKKKYENDIALLEKKNENLQEKLQSELNDKESTIKSLKEKLDAAKNEVAAASDKKQGE